MTNKYLERLKNGEDAKVIILEMSEKLDKYKEKTDKANKLYINYCDINQPDFDTLENTIEIIMSAINNGDI